MLYEGSIKDLLRLYEGSPTPPLTQELDAFRHKVCVFALDTRR